MLSYFALFTFVVVLATVSLWTIRTLRSVGKACYHAFLPSSKEKIKKEKILHRLSDKLITLPMPWGWSAASSKIPETCELIRAPVPVVIPWGWPGSSRHAEKIVLHNVVAESMECDPDAIEGGQIDVSANDQFYPAQESWLDINAKRFGGYTFATAGMTSVRNARLPWGW